MSKQYIPTSDDNIDKLTDFGNNGLDSDLSDFNGGTNFDWSSYYSKYEEKPPLNFELEGKPVTIYGGSCHHPIIEDADVYVSLDMEQPVYYWEQPWYDNEGKKHLRFPILDMFIPNNSEDFKSCIAQIQYYLTEGKKVHVGCIGGHGRTGMVLSALIQESMGDKLFDEKGYKISAIDYVRDNYAIKAVETVPQILFLHYNFGIIIPKGSSKEVNKFLECFKKEVGISLDDILEKGAAFDEVTEVLKEVDNMMYSLKFSKPAVEKSDFIKPNQTSELQELSGKSKPKL